jgi:hypothetical protein
MDLAVTGDDGDRTRDVAGVDVTLKHVSHAGQPSRREAADGHDRLPDAGRQMVSVMMSA